LIVSQIFNRHPGMDNKWLNNSNNNSSSHHSPNHSYYVQPTAVAHTNAVTLPHRISHTASTAAALLPNDNNNSSNKNVSQYAENLTQSNENHSNGGGPGRQCNNDYSKHIHYDYDIIGNEVAKRCAEKFIMSNGCENIAREFCNSMLKKIDDSHLVMAKSMPDLPKVVAIIPKGSGNTATMPKPATGQCRKYMGPVRYPVTPIRTSLSMENKRLSLLADDDEHQVYI